MAENGATIDLKAHEQTYAGFIRMMKVGAALTAVVAIIVILLIAH